MKDDAAAGGSSFIRASGDGCGFGGEELSSPVEGDQVVLRVARVTERIKRPPGFYGERPDAATDKRS
jgi:hypothetical protein